MSIRLNLGLKSHWFRLSGMTLVALVITTVITLAAAAVSARAWFTAASLIGKQSPAAQAKPDPGRLEVELITLRPHGFEPAQIKRPAGRFFLAVDNRLAVRDLNLRLDQITGSRLHEKNLTKGKSKWRELVDLPPGEYILTEASNPFWRCQIILTKP